ncbi:hypothetical protein ACDW_32740 [Acidovorax sp. DW039]|nr:hypothetical protein ACDW_32740 [Acidovorax sp. DW039]
MKKQEVRQLGAVWWRVWAVLVPVGGVGADSPYGACQRQTVV